jgi:LysR family transcriptional regulator, flagellar master operon regulator
LDTELLRTFLEVRNTRHFGRAAQNLYITQAAVSARIRQLEESLGVSLFVRTRNNIQLTSEGERLVPHAEGILLVLSRARQDVTLEDVGGSHIAIAVRVGIWNAALQRKYYSLMRRMSGLAIQLESYEPGVIVEKLLGRSLDLAILYEPPSLPELVSTPIGELTLRLYSSNAGDTVESAMAGNYVYLDWGGGFARFHARRFGEVLVPTLRTNMNHLACDYLSQRGGACYLPASMKSSLREQGLKPVRGAPEFKRQLNAVSLSGARDRQLVDRVAECFSNVKV